jgi:hypothetical protein
LTASTTKLRRAMLSILLKEWTNAINFPHLI